MDSSIGRNGPRKKFGKILAEWGHQLVVQATLALAHSSTAMCLPN
jgi:hypothetical protein